MDRLETAGGEEVIYAILDERFPEDAAHDKIGEAMDRIFELKVDKGESTAYYVGKAREAFAQGEAEGITFPSVAREDIS